MKIYIILTSFLFLFSFYGNARIIYSVADGSWGDSSTWEDSDGNNTTPTCGDTVVINNGYTVSITSSYDYTSCSDRILIYVNSTIYFGNNGRLDLPCNSIVAIDTSGLLDYGGSGNGNNAFIKICDNTEWRAKEGDVSGPILMPDAGTMPTLSVSIIELKAFIKEDKAYINWVTSSETNNDYFIVEKSDNTLNFKPFDKIIGSGNSNQIINYISIDNTPLEETYYRLKVVDFDGNYKYIGPVYVSYKDNSIYKVFPNPITENKTLYITHNDNIKNINFSIIDIKGSYMKYSYKLYNNKISVNLNNFEKGFYFIIIETNEEVYKEKFIVE